jgi:hypothetical protein
MPVGIPGGTSAAEQAQIYTMDIQKQYGSAAAKLYQQMLKAYPQLSPKQVVQILAMQITGQGLSKVLSEGMGGVGNALAQASGSGFGTTALGNLGGGGGNDWQHLLLRIAEFLIGGILVAVGINAMLKKSDTYQKAAGTVKTAGTAAITKGIV